ncbi:MAG: WYL domain-containing protein [Myxococcales bacterium]|nr:WYL domain-containing protein [Myxococcales bacterium]
MTDDEARETDRRIHAIAEILARGVLRCFAHEDVPEAPSPPAGKQRFRILEEQVVREHPRIVALKFEFTTPRPHRAPKRPEERKQRERHPHISVQLARAHQLQKLLDEGKVKSHRELAKVADVTPARVTQLLDLLCLTPDIQEEILFFPRTTKSRNSITERDARLVASTIVWTEQRKLWADVKGGVSVRLLFHKSAAQAARERWHPTQQVRRARRGVVLSMKVRPTAELVRRILSLGNGVEVLAPTSLRQQVSAALKEAASRYAPVEDR